MRWTLQPQPSFDKVNHLASELSIDKTLASILVQRGIETFDEAKAFFRPQLSDLHNPFLMKDMEVAVHRVLEAIEKGQHILVYGDYDVDGTTSVSLMAGYLKTLTSKVATYIPDRYKEGYGISTQGIDFAADNDVSLIIALDCGIKAIEKVAYAHEKGIDFIICDHHRPGKDIPKALAVLDPKREDCHYPYDALSGCGVGFKLIQAIHESQELPFEELHPYLDLCAVSIAADIVPITGENRILAYYGLQLVNSNPRTGIKALMEFTQKKEFSITDVVFQIAPRINAAGRIHHALAAVDLLMETDFEKAKAFANEIQNFNTERKELDKTQTHEALEQIERNHEQENYTTVVYREDWHKGVIGIVASRLTETYYRPTLVFTKSGDKLAASARSVTGFDVYNALEACAEFIEQFGGHKYAAGLTLLPENYEKFKAKFEEVVRATILEEQRIPEIKVDTEIDLCNITPKFYRILKQLEPFGPGNMKPVFKANALRDNGYGKCVGQDLDHLKLNIIYGSDEKTYGAIGFGLGHKWQQLQSQEDFEAVFNLDENHWNGFTSLQLVLKDVN